MATDITTTWSLDGGLDILNIMDENTTTKTISKKDIMSLEIFKFYSQEDDAIRYQVINRDYLLALKERDRLLFEGKPSPDVEPEFFDFEKDYFDGQIPPMILRHNYLTYPINNMAISTLLARAKMKGEASVDNNSLYRDDFLIEQLLKSRQDITLVLRHNSVDAPEVIAAMGSLYKRVPQNVLADLTEKCPNRVTELEDVGVHADQFKTTVSFMVKDKDVEGLYEFTTSDTGDAEFKGTVYADGVPLKSYGKKHTKEAEIKPEKYYEITGILNDYENLKDRLAKIEVEDFKSTIEYILESQFGKNGRYRIPAKTLKSLRREVELETEESVLGSASGYDVLKYITGIGSRMVTDYKSTFEAVLQSSFSNIIFDLEDLIHDAETRVVALMPEELDEEEYTPEITATEEEKIFDEETSVPSKESATCRSLKEDEIELEKDVAKTKETATGTKARESETPDDNWAPAV